MPTTNNDLSRREFVNRALLAGGILAGTTLSSGGKTVNRPLGPDPSRAVGARYWYALSRYHRPRQPV